MTMKMGIERRLMENIPEIFAVEQVADEETGLELNEENIEKLITAQKVSPLFEKFFSHPYTFILHSPNVFWTSKYSYLVHRGWVQNHMSEMFAFHATIMSNTTADQRFILTHQMMDANFISLTFKMNG